MAARALHNNLAAIFGKGNMSKQCENCGEEIDEEFLAASVHLDMYVCQECAVIATQPEFDEMDGIEDDDEGDI